MQTDDRVGMEWWLVAVGGTVDREASYCGATIIGGGADGDRSGGGRGRCDLDGETGETRFMLE